MLRTTIGAGSRTSSRRALMTSDDHLSGRDLRFERSSSYILTGQGWQQTAKRRILRGRRMRRFESGSQGSNPALPRGTGARYHCATSASSPEWTRTTHLARNRGALCQMSYRGPSGLVRQTLAPRSLVVQVPRALSQKLVWWHLLGSPPGPLDYHQTRRRGGRSQPSGSSMTSASMTAAEAASMPASSLET